ncbi:MAG: hypothetical protein L3J62_06710 [Gammaproteobacteria bacterium]|nr:hypothetical protein [Gammaproteobacteria bacterium]
MAALGEMKLFGDNNEYDSGVAFELLTAPKKMLVESYKSARIQLSSGIPLIICSFNGAGDRSEALKQGAELVEEYLDLLSFILGIDLAIKNRDKNTYAWWLDGDKKVVNVTLSYVYLLSPEVHMELVSKDAAGKVIPPVIVSPKHHNILRFFRLSQVTDNLFEAYRNLYLSFELLASVIIPKGKKTEKKWLISALTEMNGKFGLFKYICNDEPLSILQVIYDDSRLPLFHAKEGKCHYLPASSDTDRSVVQKALNMLSDILLCVVPQKFSTKRKRGCVLASSVIDDKESPIISGGNSFIVSGQAIGNDYREGKIELSDPWFMDGVDFPIKIESIKGSHAEITGTIEVAQLATATPLTTIDMVNSEYPVLMCDLDAAFDVSGFDRLDVGLSIEFDGDGNHPKRHYSC